METESLSRLIGVKEPCLASDDPTLLEVVPAQTATSVAVGMTLKNPAVTGRHGTCCDRLARNSLPERKTFAHSRPCPQAPSMSHSFWPQTFVPTQTFILRSPFALTWDGKQKHETWA